MTQTTVIGAQAHRSPTSSLQGALAQWLQSIPAICEHNLHRFVCPSSLCVHAYSTRSSTLGDTAGGGSTTVRGENAPWFSQPSHPEHGSRLFPGITCCVAPKSRWLSPLLPSFHQLHSSQGKLVTSGKAGGELRGCVRRAAAHSNSLTAAGFGSLRSPFSVALR